MVEVPRPRSVPTFPAYTLVGRPPAPGSRGTVEHDPWMTCDPRIPCERVEEEGGGYSSHVRRRGEL